MLVLMTLFSASAPAKQEVTRQLGGACGEDANIKATCAVGLQCKNGYCAMSSFLSGAVVGCKAEMQKAGVDPKEFVAVHDGFCYIDDKCPDLYRAAIATRSFEYELMDAVQEGPDAFSAALARLSEEQKASLKRAEDICDSCRPYCVR
jgi:hypothetical protein